MVKLTIRYKCCLVPWINFGMLVQMGGDMGIIKSLFKTRQPDTYYEKRRRPRLNCSIATEFTDAKGYKWSCKIVDMSESGFAITTSAKLGLGHVVNITRPCVSTEVVWATDSKAGLRIAREQST